MGGGIGRIHRANGDELTRVVPFVEGLGGVDALVALEADQLAVQERGEHLRDLRLAHACLPFQEERLAER